MKKSFFETQTFKNALMMLAVVVFIALPSYSLAVGPIITTSFTGTLTSNPGTTTEIVDLQEQSGGSNNTMTASGTISGTPVAGNFVLSNLRQVTILGLTSGGSSSYTGWGYVTGNYSFSGYSGQIYTVFNSTGQAWSVLEGAIHAVGLINFGAATTGRIYLTSINGYFESGTIDLTSGTTSFSNSSSLYHYIRLDITTPSDWHLNCSGQYSSTADPAGALLYLSNNTVPLFDEGISYGIYRSDLGNYDYHQYMEGCYSGSCVPHGMSEGEIFGIHTFVMTSQNTLSGSAEHVIAVAPAAGQVTLEPAPGVTVTGDVGNGNTLTAVPAIDANGNQPSSNFKLNGYIYDISVSNPSSVNYSTPLAICLQCGGSCSGASIWHENPPGTWTTTLQPAPLPWPSGMICGETYSLSNFAVGTPPADLPRTGQTTSYYPGDDGDIQAGVAWPNQRFTDNGDQTVTDNLTGLMWTKDAGTPTVGSCSGGNWQQGLDYAACLNGTNYLGHNDWRLPNTSELYSLSNFSVADIFSWLNTQGFINTPTSGVYWSSTALTDDSSLAWAYSWLADVGFISKNTGLSILLVRAGQGDIISIPRTGQVTSYVAGDDGAIQAGIAWPNPRFTDNGDGTVTDNLTALIWLKNANCTDTAGGIDKSGGALTWTNALIWTNNLTSGQCGLTDSSSSGDWRLSNINELYSLAGNKGPHDISAWLNTQSFINVQYSHYWSSTTFQTQTFRAYTVAMWGGAVQRTFDKGSGAGVWPVRGGTVTQIADTTPDPFAFTGQTDVTLSTVVTSNTITVSGINSPATITITGGEYSINSGAFTSASGTVNNGNTVQVRQTSSGSYSTATNTTLTIGGVSDTFSVTTIAADTTPDPFTFADQTGVSLGTVATSNTITVSGINSPATITITGGVYSINGGVFTSASGTVNNGDTVQVRLTSADAYSTTTSATLTIGGVSDTFSVTTLASSDLCPSDPNKTAPGICGCGVADTDSDADGTPNCNDGCLSDPNKIAAGVCGCGIADSDSDGDGTLNCNDSCPSDPLKISQGICGCGSADVDSDSDGVYNCYDNCPNDPNKIEPGVAGCGVLDTSVPPGTDVVVGPEPGLTLDFDNVTTGGGISVTELSNPSPPANFRIPSGKSYEINFDGTFTGNVTVCINYDDADVHGSENNLKLMHRGTQGWQDITTTRDTVNNIICGVTTSFSEFAVAESVDSSLIPTPKFVVGYSATQSYAVTLTAASSSCPSGVTSCTYNWTFGDGGTATGTSASHTYPNAGPYTATLRVVTDINTDASINKTVTPLFINQPPVASFTMTFDANTWTATVTDNSTDDLGIKANGVTIRWGDGRSDIISGGGSKSHTYLATGNYTITELVVDTGAPALSKISTGQIVSPANFRVTGNVATFSGGSPALVNSVLISLMQNGVVKANTYTNTSGAYTFPNVKGGTYDVRAFKTGAEFVLSPKSVTVGPNGTVNFDLKKTKFKVTSTVTASGQAHRVPA